MSDNTSLSPEQVADYLRHHPDLLCHYPELIDRLQWPEDPRTTSLIQHQVLRLRRKNEQLELQLKQLAGIAGENQRLMQRLHHLTLEVMTAESNAHFITRLFELLAHDFSAEMARLHLIDEHPDLNGLECVHAHPATRPEWFDKLLDKGVPYCGRLTRKKAELLFPAKAAAIGSSALIPIPGLGLLAIGSERQDRFHPAMGTLFLELLSATIGYRLKRLERDDRKRA
jgi:uncharacterized protein YigA (DUF484 family)